MLKGLLNEPAGIVSNKESIANTENAIKNWNLGPMEMDNPSPAYWNKMGTVFGISPDEARTRICANCSYYNNTPETLAEMRDKYPLNKYDVYFSPYHRGYCEKLHFACHTTRSCQAHEPKEFELEDD